MGEPSVVVVVELVGRKPGRRRAPSSARVDSHAVKIDELVPGEHIHALGTPLAKRNVRLPS
jgi:hypothetical protein